MTVKAARVQPSRLAETVDRCSSSRWFERKSAMTESSSFSSSRGHHVGQCKTTMTVGVTRDEDMSSDAAAEAAKGSWPDLAELTARRSYSRVHVRVSTFGVSPASSLAMWTWWQQQNERLAADKCQNTANYTYPTHCDNGSDHSTSTTTQRSLYGHSACRMLSLSCSTT